jgi:hypothetical protein
MKITRNNIDELLFEYFEGNLSENQKGRLMNFIHHNPEFNEDFSSWAQSYSHKNEDTEDYGITSKLLRQEPGQFQISQKMVLLSVALMVSFITCLSVYFSGTKEADAVLLNKSSVGVKAGSDGSEKGKNTAAPNVNISNPKYVLDKRLKDKRDQINHKEPKSSWQILPDSSGFQAVKSDDNSRIIDSASTDRTSLTISTDSLSQKKVEIPNIEPEKIKRKMRLDLRPDSKFLPVNKDL